MKGDFSTWNKDRAQNFRGTLHQQGRVLLDRDWNVFRRRDFEGLVNVVNTPAVPVDAQGRYIISGFAPDDREEVQTSSSLWRIKVGLSYRF